MDTPSLNLLFGWAAVLSAVATVATAVTAILFFSVAERFGPINDAVSVVQVLLMLPVAWGLYHVTRPGAPTLALLAAAIGGIAMLVTALLQTLLVAGAVTFEQTIATVLGAGGVIGIWLVLALSLIHI